MGGLRWEGESRRDAAPLVKAAVALPDDSEYDDSQPTSDSPFARDLSGGCTIHQLSFRGELILLDKKSARWARA